MSGKKLLLLDTLRALSLGDDVAPPDISTNDYLRACFLLVSSHSVESCESAERLGFDTFVDDSTGTPVQTRGLSLPGSECLVFDIVDALSEADAVPEEVTVLLGDVSLADYRAALFAIRCIMYAVQWTEWDEKAPREFDATRANAVLRSSLRQLMSFRATGEP